ncbi:soluble epoxide hydrolase / lipid-phosphate phosphatase [Entomortierella parvispora]|uniref:Soluble epoxide hydrolase / lipid-phosphate phosphatase n=1 Tax=Entomortierella parvispora TaxID=205924 RepID=A0A9P3H503_9FUNG|nr:soluble epoxide hydrolase / lipid-phosphate phosphatase [Entomortierella parvispora]
MFSRFFASVQRQSRRWSFGNLKTYFSGSKSTEDLPVETKALAVSLPLEPTASTQTTPTDLFFNGLLAIKAHLEANPRPRPDMTAVNQFVNSLNHQYVSLNGRRYHYVDEGNPKHETLVLVHGFPDTWFGWRKQIPFLVQKGYRVIVVDCLGYGETVQPRCIGNDVHPYRAKRIASDFIALLDHLHVPKAVFIGHDWGAALVWTTGHWFPERCNSVISIGNPYMFPEKVFLSTESLMAINPNMFYVALFESAAPEYWFEGNTRTLAEVTYESMFPDANHGTSDAEREYYITSFAQTSFHGGYNYYRSRLLNHEDELSLVGQKYTVPSMLLMIKDDPVLTLSWCEAFNDKDKDMFVDLEIQYIETGGHRSLTENAKEVNEHLAAYLGATFSNNAK